MILPGVFLFSALGEKWRIWVNGSASSGVKSQLWDSGWRAWRWGCFLWTPGLVGFTASLPSFVSQPFHICLFLDSPRRSQKKRLAYVFHAVSVAVFIIQNYLTASHTEGILPNYSEKKSICHVSILLSLCPSLSMSASDFSGLKIHLWGPMWSSGWEHCNYIALPSTLCSKTSGPFLRSSS